MKQLNVNRLIDDFSKVVQKTLTVTLLVMVGSLLITKVTTGKATYFGYVPLYVASESMEPEILTNQFILAKAIEAKDVKIGDIVTYKLQSNVIGTAPKITHRIVAVNKDGTYVTKGDNNETCDELPVHSEQILYKIVWY